jgi:magnesium-transporting ATPase (P-type)
MARASVQGLWVLLSAALAYGVSTRLPQAGDALGHSRTMVMVAFVVANGWLIFIAKAQGSRLLHIGKPTNRAAVVIAIGTVALVLLAIYVPWLAAQMKFYPLGPQALTLAMACGSLGLVARITWDALAGRTKAAG